MKNKKVLIILALIGIICLGSSAYYYKNYMKPIYMSYTQSDELLTVYSAVDNCSKLGFISKDSDSDIKNIIERIRIPTQDGKGTKALDMVLVEKTSNEILDSLISDKTIDLTNTLGVGYSIMKSVCTSKQEQAKNIKNQY